MINNLTTNIGSSGTVALGSPMTVAGTLTLAQGNINIAKNDLTMMSTGTLTGGSSASYIVTSDTGSLIMTVANAGASTMFPVGTSAHYAATTVTNNSSTAGSFSVNTHPGVYSAGTTGSDLSATESAVNTSWNVESSITSGANVNLTMEWSAAMQVNNFNSSESYVSHYTGGAWSTNTMSAATLTGGMYSQSLTGITSFSPFAVFSKNTAGIATVGTNDMLQVYPNPVSDRLTIQTGSADATHVEVTDISGRIVGSYILSAGQNTIGVAGLSTGSYFIKVSNNEMNTTRKFVKI
jgi:hypothetical protein